MSGGGPSSIKRSPQCAARAPVLSRRYEDRVGATFDFKVYGLVLQFGTVFVWNEESVLGRTFERGAGRITFLKGFPLRISHIEKEGRKHASGLIQKMASANL